MQLDLLNVPAKKASGSVSSEGSTPVMTAGHSQSHEAVAQVDAPLVPREKAPDAFKTITEVAEQLDVQQYVLRFWESKFSQVKPVKMRGGRRYYRPEDVDILVTIKNLLYKQGYTIKGAKKALSVGVEKASKLKAKTQPKMTDDLSDRQMNQLAVIRQELMGLRDVLKPFVF